MELLFSPALPDRVGVSLKVYESEANCRGLKITKWLHALCEHKWAVDGDTGKNIVLSCEKP